MAKINEMMLEAWKMLAMDSKEIAQRFIDTVGMDTEALDTTAEFRLRKKQQYARDANGKIDETQPIAPATASAPTVSIVLENGRVFTLSAAVNMAGGTLKKAEPGTVVVNDTPSAPSASATQLAAKNAQVIALTATLRELGMTDEEIAEKLASAG